MRSLRYLQTGFLLHLITVCSVLGVYYFGEKFATAVTTDGPLWQILLFGFLTGHFFSLIFFSQIDSRSRFQNYKLAKDKLYEHGFDTRLIRPFAYSRCQRDAISVAAWDMNYKKEWKQFSRELGFRWYHILPHYVIKKPSILLTREYWDKTLFVKHYKSKYFLW